MSKLFVFTNAFPYGYREPYLESEVEYYKSFNAVTVISLQIKSNEKSVLRKIPGNIKVLPVFFASKYIYIFNTISTLRDKNLYIEFFKLLKTKRLGVKSLVKLFVFFSRAHYEANIIKSKLSKKDFDDSVFYIYRFDYQPYVALLLRDYFNIHNRIYSRAHGYDLYEYRHPFDYIPMREFLLKNLYKVFPCSEDGTRYLKKNYSEYKDKICTKYLGTQDHGIQVYKEKEYFHIISCSNVVSIKRLDLIIKALSRINLHKIKWTHFGDGDLMKDIVSQAINLPENIIVDFKGNIDNIDLLKNYEQNYYDLFINVSSTEGIPVSIMEAMSFGIPCLATNAGGTAEIVQNDVSGKIIPIDVSADEIACTIEFFICMDKKEYLIMRKNARRLWNEKFNAARNYRSFIEAIRL